MSGAACLCQCDPLGSYILELWLFLAHLGHSSTLLALAFVTIQVNGYASQLQKLQHHILTSSMDNNAY